MYHLAYGLWSATNDTCIHYLACGGVLMAVLVWVSTGRHAMMTCVSGDLELYNLVATAMIAPDPVQRNSHRVSKSVSKSDTV